MYNHFSCIASLGQSDPERKLRKALFFCCSIYIITMLAGARLAVVLLIAILGGVVDVKSQSQSRCRTMRQEIGRCVPVMTCSTITTLLEISPRPLPKSITQFIRGSHCGTFNSMHHVCCESSRVTSGSSHETVTLAPHEVPVTKPSTISPGSGPIIRAGALGSSEDVQSGMAILQAIKCGNSDLDKVGNGIDALLSEFPWMVLLVYNDGGDSSMECGGSLITDRYVLTSAHCIRTASSSKLVKVRLGEHDINETTDCAGFGRRRRCAPATQEIDVEESIYHRDFSRSEMHNDIGLLRLASKAVFNSAVQPICLPITESSKSAIISRVIIAGWGRMENGVNANILQKAVLPVRTIDFCKAIHRLIEFTDTHMCAGAQRDVDTCKGDSGGPIFFTALYEASVRWVQYGVVTAGGSQCGRNFPGIYMRVTSYLQWIAANIKP